MTDPFDWTGLWRKTADVFKKHGENIAATTIDDMDRAAAAYLRERIEAAFVPAWQHKATCIGYSLDVEEATARAEAAEARVKALSEALTVLETALKQIAGSHWERWGFDQTDIDEIPDHSGEEAMNIARQALGGEHG